MRFSLIAVWVGLSAESMCAQPAPEAVHKIFGSFHNQSPGCAVGVAQEGRELFSAGYGMADLERGVPITPQTVFESGSVAKQFTAAALMLLAADKKISLDDPMRKYLPELQDYGPTLTIRHVIHHVSGLREWRPLALFHGEAEGTRVISNQDILRYAARQKTLNFDPGTTYSYSNTGFNMAAILIERVLGNGQTFADFVRERIFTPLEMKDSSWRDDFRRVVPRRALAYAKRNGRYGNDTPIENIVGAGGMLTTVHDLMLWNENFRHARVGGAAFVQAQQKPATLSGGRTIAYAAGLQVTEQGGLSEVAHSGATGGYRTWLGRYPSRELSVAVLCNAGDANAVELGRQTAGLWLDVKLTQGEAAAEVRDASSWTGAYRNTRNNTVRKLTAGQFPLGSARFEAIEGPGKVFRLRDVNDTAQYERVELVQPSRRELVEYVGVFRSDEAPLPVEVRLGTDGVLSMHIGNQSTIPLEPTFRDAFATRQDSSVRFWRDAQNRITGLSVGDARVWDFRFTKR
jgi:CubicO group peptidase (beta-lactamase class C family)